MGISKTQEFILKIISQNFFLNTARNFLEIILRLQIFANCQKISVFGYQLNNRRFLVNFVKTYSSGFVENLKTILRF